MPLGLLMFLGIAFIAGPIAASIMGHPIGSLPTSILIVVGIVLTLVSALLLIITKLYVKTKANEAFVRTGMGGIKVVQDGGAIVFPVIHQIVTVQLGSKRLEVKREGVDALITKDKLRADIKAEFFVRVPPVEESIKSAARSFGDQMNNDAFVTSLVEDKLVSALRNVAATKTLEELNTQRDEFIKQVTLMIEGDLAHNGLTLETATISKLDQTDPKNLRRDNIFDAQGLQTIAEVTQAAQTIQNQREREGELARKTQDVKTRQDILALEQQQAVAEANQKSKIAQVNAEQNQAAGTARIDSERTVQLAEVNKQQQLDVAEQVRSQATEVAEKEKKRALTVADQSVEVAERERQAAVATAETVRVNAETARALAEAERETANQAVITVGIVATAERDKQKQVITAQATAETAYVSTQRAADGAAYKLNAEADAKKKAAEAEASAITTKATADAIAVEKKADAESNANVKKAEGEKALALVPIQVQAEQVKVDQSRVTDVLIPELEARDKNGKAAQEFVIAQLHINREADVRIATAQASVHLFEKVTATLIGSPSDLAKIQDSFMQGTSSARMIEGFLGSAGPKTTNAIEQSLQKMGDLVSAVAEHVGVKKSGDAPATHGRESATAAPAEAKASKGNSASV